jgi:predicted transcriptional regulator
MEYGAMDITEDIRAMTTFRNWQLFCATCVRPSWFWPCTAKPPWCRPAEAYQQLLELAAEASAAEGIRQGLEDVADGRTRPAREVLDEIRAEYDIPRRADGAGEPESQTSRRAAGGTSEARPDCTPLSRNDFSVENYVIASEIA